MAGFIDLFLLSIHAIGYPGCSSPILSSPSKFTPTTLGLMPSQLVQLDSTYQMYRTQKLETHAEYSTQRSHRSSQIAYCSESDNALKKFPATTGACTHAPPLLRHCPQSILTPTLTITLTGICHCS